MVARSPFHLGSQGTLQQEGGRHLDDDGVGCCHHALVAGRGHQFPPGCRCFSLSGLLALPVFSSDEFPGLAQRKEAKTLRVTILLILTLSFLS